MYNATWLAVSATATGSQGRGTRFRSYFKENGYHYFQGAIVWVVDGNSSLNRGFVSNTSVLWQGNPWEGRMYQVHTLENMIPAQYHTGVTTIHSFQSDGQFVPLNASDKLGGIDNRRMEFIGDSITAATNVNRPEGAQAGCGDSGFQADWSQTYSALLCHRFGAACSTIAYGGKCMMREHNCGGLQMPDYFLSALSTGCKGHPGTAPWPSQTYAFPTSEAPDAMFIDLGTNDIARAEFPKAEGGDPAFELRFATETVAFMQNATRLYKKPDIQFFLNAGPMENKTMNGTLQAVAMAHAAGLHATFVDTRRACVSGRIHQANDAFDRCDGCAGHPGVEGHRGIYEAAWPVIAKVMNWTDVWPAAPPKEV
eukprot:SAG31_NODE_767_length_12232_cov_6.917827_13_plen_368_part_00